MNDLDMLCSADDIQSQISGELKFNAKSITNSLKFNAKEDSQSYNESSEICRAKPIKEQESSPNNLRMRDFTDRYKSKDWYKRLGGITWKDNEPTEICIAKPIVEQEKTQDSTCELNMRKMFFQTDSENQKSTKTEALIFNAKSKDYRKTEPDIVHKESFSIFPKTTSNKISDSKKLNDTRAKTDLNSEKVTQKNLTLQYLQTEVTDKVQMILHNNGLYYHNNRSYVAVKNYADLLLIIRSSVSSDAFGISNLRIIQSLYEYMKADKNLIPKDYEQKLKKAKKLVVLKNGVLDMDTLELKKHNPKYLKTFELNANWVDDELEVFNEFLRVSCQDDKQAIRRAKESLGYIFSGSNEGKVFFVIGIARDSGKSTLGIVIEHIIGRDYISAIPPEKLGDRFALGSNRGKILNIAMDVPGGKLNANVVSMIKSITGNDTITIEQKYMPTETIVSDSRFLFGTNYPIKISSNNDEEAFWQRMILIPFTNTIDDSEKDNNLVEKLLLEKDAIVSSCLRAYKKVRDNNYRFSKCQLADDMLTEWKNGKTSSYSFAAYWNDCVDVTGDYSHKIHAKILHEAYLEYCYNES